MGSSTTLVSPVTIGTGTSLAVSSIERRTLSRTSMSKPSPIIIELARAKGLAPITARSFTVPLTASLPMSPPGKKSGLTVWPSIVKTRCLSPSGIVAPSSRASSPIPPALFRVRVFNITSLRSSSIISPPAPCSSFIFSLIFNPPENPSMRGSTS